MSKNKKTALILIILTILISFVPLFMLKGAEFVGADTQGSTMVDEITGGYEPWFTPLMEKWIGGELPSEMESFFFCIQTGIGVGVIAFIMGRLYERKKYEDSKYDNESKDIKK